MNRDQTGEELRLRECLTTAIGRDIAVSVIGKDGRQLLPAVLLGRDTTYGELFRLIRVLRRGVSLPGEEKVIRIRLREV